MGVQLDVLGVLDVPRVLQNRWCRTLLCMSSTPEPGPGRSQVAEQAERSSELRPEQLQRILRLRSRYLASRLLAAFARDGAVLRSKTDFEQRSAKLLGGDIDGKLRFLFNLYDSDGSGALEHEELDRMLHIELAENGILIRPADSEQLLAAMLREADLDGGGSLCFGEFRSLIDVRPRLRDRLAEHGVALLRPKPRRLPAKEDGRVRGWIRQRGVLAFWVAVCVAANIALFVSAFLSYRAQGANIWVQIARGGGACLNLDGPLLLVPMLRHLWSALRRTPLGRVLPLDETIGLHRMIGEAVFVFSLVHTGAHLVNVAVVGGALTGAAYISGFALLLVLLLIWGFARDRVRASGRFELFHRVHATYWLWFVIAILHGPVFWIWLLAPGLLFVVEQLMRVRRRSDASHLLEAQVLPGGVTKLRFDRPLGFEYEAGDFIFLRVPAVAKSEWHPFTLSSAPEDPDWLTVHVRVLGNWTQALAERFAVPGSERGEMVYIDGPYGTPSAHIWGCEHAVTIAAGIGVTPFASVLQSLQNLEKRHRRHPSEAVEFRLRRLHFVWICREQVSFEWFHQLLAELELRNDGWLDIQIYFTSARADLTGGVVDLARAILRESRGVDMVTGLRANTHFGRPDLDAMLQSFKDERDIEAPEVFFCGPAGLARGVEASCRRLDLRYRYERF